MRKFIGAVAAASLMVIAPAFAADAPKHTVRPRDGYVPDGKTAIRIAVAIWEPIYGEKQIAREKPYLASLTNGVWTVTGSLPRIPFVDVKGGTAIAEISKEDGRILRVSHGK